MRRSTALIDYEDALSTAAALLEIDRRLHRDPPTQAQQRASAALRGGSVVLMCAALEAYLKDAFQEQAASVLLRGAAYNRLPARFRVENTFRSLNRAMSGPRFGLPGTKEARLPDVINAAQLVVSGGIDPIALAETGGNPRPDLIKDLFANWDYSDVFGRIRADFERAWGKPEAQSYARDKLDEILDRRNNVAHAFTALDASRGDLREYVKFLRVLGRVLDRHLRNHVAAVIKAAH